MCLKMGANIEGYDIPVRVQHIHRAPKNKYLLFLSVRIHHSACFLEQGTYHRRKGTGKIKKNN